MAARKQAPSWTSPYGTTEQPHLVGQIFFPTNSKHLDAQDKEVLDALVDGFRFRLLNKYVQFDFLGHADHRGSAAYNKELSRRRIDAVRAYLDALLQPFRTYSSTFGGIARGEDLAGRRDLELDRRVDILSDVVLKPKPMEFPPEKVTGKPPARFVRRPTTFLSFDHRNMIREGLSGDKDSAGFTDPGFQIIIVEESAMIDKEKSFPYAAKTRGHKQISTFPMFVQLTRYEIQWRKPEAKDDLKSVSKHLLNIMASALGGPGGYDFGTGVPKLKPPNFVYSDWQEFARKDPESAKEWQQYYRRPF